MPSAYLLVSHGSRDLRPGIAMQQLVNLVSQSAAQGKTASGVQVGDIIEGNNPSWGQTGISCLPRSQPLVDKACLELTIPLSEQILEFGDRALKMGCQRMQIVPVFLLAGTHVMEDIPAQVAIAQQAMEQKLQIDLRPHVGTHPDLKRLLTPTTAAEAWILLAHGSRRPGSTSAVEVIAAQLQAHAAYWAIAPKLEARVQDLIRAGYRQIGIMPYFLFAGGITDAIAQMVRQLQTQFPAIELHLAEPIGASQQLADVILDLVE